MQHRRYPRCGRRNERCAICRSSRRHEPLAGCIPTPGGRFHHRAHHDGEYSIELAAQGQFVFRDRHGRRIQRGPPEDVDDGESALRARNRANGVSIDASTAVPQWYAGDVIDYSLPVDALVAIDEKHSAGGDDGSRGGP